MHLHEQTIWVKAAVVRRHGPQKLMNLMPFEPQTSVSESPSANRHAITP